MKIISLTTAVNVGWCVCLLLFGFSFWGFCGGFCCCCLIVVVLLLDSLGIRGISVLAHILLFN